MGPTKPGSIQPEYAIKGPILLKTDFTNVF